MNILLSSSLHITYYNYTNYPEYSGSAQPLRHCAIAELQTKNESPESGPVLSVLNFWFVGTLVWFHVVGLHVIGTGVFGAKLWINCDICLVFTWLYLLPIVGANVVDSWCILCILYNINTCHFHYHAATDAKDSIFVFHMPSERTSDTHRTRNLFKVDQIWDSVTYFEKIQNSFYLCRDGERRHIKATVEPLSSKMVWLPFYVFFHSLSFIFIVQRGFMCLPHPFV